MKRYWRRNPPVHRLLAWIVDYEAPQEPEENNSAYGSEQAEESPDALNNLIRDFMAAGGVVG